MICWRFVGAQVPFLLAAEDLIGQRTFIIFFFSDFFFFTSILVYFRFSAFFKMYRIRILKDHRCRHDICTENSDQSPKSPTETSLGMPRTEFSGAHRAEIMSVSTRRRVFFSPPLSSFLQFFKLPINYCVRNK